ncbi:MAG: hypothetical protein BWY72_02154 [Bacteroidetes bacterium ADurb.Bin416]|nr:MAG: hypothetical protein BWY72_02154 [Bacteroidetes bacterium ADurb.Bin416]
MLNRVLVDFEPVIHAPLLSFVFDVVLHDNHLVEAQTSDQRLRLPRSDVDGG